VKEARLVDLGVREFAEVWKLQLELVGARQRDEIPDTLLFVEHPHVITAGRSAKRENLLDLGGTPLFEIERGGDVTYHGPGQLVGYPILDLAPDRRDVHRYVRDLEEVMIRTCAAWGVEASRVAGLTGAWVGADKIGAIGVRIARWVTSHGFALNVATDLARFAAINPCGLDAAVMGSMAGELGRPQEMAAVKDAVRATVAEVFGRQI